jgi:biotin synthase-like enzyme
MLTHATSISTLTHVVHIIINALEGTTMTKGQTHEVAMARIHVYLGNIESAARSLSSEIRAAYRESDKAEILKVAAELGLTAHPDFII